MQVGLPVFCRALDLVERDLEVGHSRYSEVRKLHAADSARKWRAAFRAADPTGRGVITEGDLRLLAEQLRANESHSL